MKNELLDIYNLTPFLIEGYRKIDLNNVIINFIDGPKVEILGGDKNSYQVIFRDNGQIIHFDTITNNMWTKCSRTYFTNWEIEIITHNDQLTTYRYNLVDKIVYIVLDSFSLGDNIAWIPYVEEFRKKHSCDVICSTFFNNLFIGSYPEIKFVNPGTLINNIYAKYVIGAFTDQNKTPKDFRDCNLQEMCSSILGLEFKEIIPLLTIKKNNRPIEDKYICISTASTAGCKHWQNKNGWQEIVNYLNDIGYKIVVIQKESLDFMDLTGLNDVIHPKTSDIQDAINWILHSEFVIGISSGISWLAWALNKKVILVSGFTNENVEFGTLHRVINKNACNGCWNNKKYRFDPGDWNWCPEHKGTDRQFECSKSITSDMVINEINKILI